VKTYWFTIAEGAKYRVHAEHLKRSLAAFNIELQVLASENTCGAGAKRRKIRGILDAPRDCDRIVYLDADTLVVNPEGIEQVDGAWQIPWPVPITASVPKEGDLQKDVARLRGFYREHELFDLAEGGTLAGVEWNSGVIIGNRDTLSELAREWDLWWARIDALFDGRFRRDQVSFRIAYKKVAKDLAGWTGLPASFHWIASYYGIHPQANILHRTMVRNVPWLEEGWNEFVSRRLAGDTRPNHNLVFDVSGIVAEKPSLERRTNFDLPAQLAFLRETLTFSRPRNALLCGTAEKRGEVKPLVAAFALALEQVDDSTEIRPDQLREFDLIVFCGADYSLQLEQAQGLGEDCVCCFVGIHDMKQYRFLFDVPYVRVFDDGCGLYSKDSKITRWRYLL
jgi:hypothetical protein